MYYASWGKGVWAPEQKAWKWNPNFYRINITEMILKEFANYSVRIWLLRNFEVGAPSENKIMHVRKPVAHWIKGYSMAN